VEKVGGAVTNIVTLIELEDLNGRQKLEGYAVKSIIKYDK
jgi:adenine phosphoribosyltransferase